MLVWPPEAVGLVVAAIIAGAAYTGPRKQTNSPIDNPTPSVTETAVAIPPRRLTYADVPSEQAPNWRIHTIRYGDERLRLGEVLHMDVTDDGVAVLAEDGVVYFSDGSSVEEIGRTSIETSFSDSGVKAASAGSLLAWFTPAEPDPSLVVYDTHDRQVVAQVRVPGCVPGQCRLVTVVGDRVYWSESDPPAAERPLRVLGLSSGAVSATDEAALADVPAHVSARVRQGRLLHRRRGRHLRRQPGERLLRACWLLPGTASPDPRDR